MSAPASTALDRTIEEATQRLASRLDRLTDRHRPRIFHPAALQDAMLSLMMKDEDLRYRVLRFVDVYPALRTPEALAAHFEEYLSSPQLAHGLRSTPMLGWARRAAAIGRRVPGLVRPISRFAVTQMARQFIAGDTPENVAPTIRRLQGEGFHFSLDLLGEFVASERQAEAFAKRYLEMIERFGAILGGSAPRGVDAGPRVNVSIKLSSLASKFEPADPEGTSESVRARLRPLFRAARQRNVFLNVDMEKHEYRDLTLRIIRDLLSEPEFRGWPHVGTVAQAYLADADVSLRKHLDWMEQTGQEMTIRLVKGAYWDSEQLWAGMRGWDIPVILVKRDTDAMFERCTRMLLERHAVARTAIGSHNMRSIAHALALRDTLRVPHERFECQMLFGMAGPIRYALRELGVPLRIYTPCGDLLEGMAYLVRRILENTSNESFLRQRFAEGGGASLLEDPKRIRRPDLFRRLKAGRSRPRRR